MTLRPNDYDRNGDIIPSGWKEEKGDTISRSALIKKFDDYIKANPNVSGVFELGKFIIDNAPTVETFTFEDMQKAADTAHGYGILEGRNERPKGEWNYIQAGMAICPFCGANPHQHYKNFCPNCGADMRTKEGDNK